MASLGRDRAHELPRPLDGGLRADEPQEIAALHDRPRRDRDVLPAPAETAHPDATEHRLAAHDVLQRPAGQLLVGEQHVEGRGRHVEQFPVLDFLGRPADHLDQHLPAARDGDDVAVNQDHRRFGLDDLAVTVDALHEYPGVWHHGLGLGHRPPDGPAIGREPVRAQLEGAPRRDGPRAGLRDPELGLELRRLGAQIDAEQERRPRAAEQDDPDRPEHVAHGVRDRDVTDQPAPLGLWQGQRVDRLGGRADRRRLRQAPGEQARRESRIQVQVPGDGERGPETHGRDEDAEDDRASPVALERAEELRPDRIADPEHEHQEEDRLGRPGDGHVPDLPDEQAREQRARDRAEAEPLILYPPIRYPSPTAQVHREVGVTVKEVTEPGHGPPSRQATA